MLPSALREFVSRCVPSVEHLETLLLLRRTADRWWTAQAVDAELGTPSASGPRRLEELCSLGFLDVRVAEDIHYRYAPTSPDKDGQLQALAEVYHARPLSVLRLMAARPLGAVRDFADAFRITKKDDTRGNG